MCIRRAVGEWEGLAQGQGCGLVLGLTDDCGRGIGLGVLSSQILGR